MPRLANEQEEHFCRRYVSHWNVKKALREAGFGIDNGYHMRLKPRVKKRIMELNESMLNEADITAKRVLLELARVGFSDIRKIVDSDGRLRPLGDLDSDTAASISAIEVESRMEKELVEDLATGEMHTRMTPVVTTKIKKSDKVAALNILAKHFKLVGDEGDGVNALASALADRLQSARRRVAVVNSQEIEDARIIDNDTARVQPALGAEVSQRRDGDWTDDEGEHPDRLAEEPVRG